ncbi:hypothetical protein GGF41_005840 [Coemansia sp. RSA 2531]|nr:hypothetical protein GGF41_005840 [Coemansia sp. RSA 2531]
MPFMRGWVPYIDESALLTALYMRWTKSLLCNGPSQHGPPSSCLDSHCSHRRSAAVAADTWYLGVEPLPGSMVPKG